MKMFTSDPFIDPNILGKLSNVLNFDPLLLPGLLSYLKGLPNCFSKLFIHDSDLWL